MADDVATHTGILRTDQPFSTGPKTHRVLSLTKDELECALLDMTYVALGRDEVDATRTNLILRLGKALASFGE